MERKKQKTHAQANGHKMGGTGGFWRSLTVEPALLTHMLSLVLVYMVVQDFMTEKVCSVNLGYSDKVCKALMSQDGSGDAYQEEKVEVQKMIGTLMMARTFLENFFPLFLVLLIGAWSDKYGRKLPMLFVLAAYVVQNVVLLLCVFFRHSLGGWTVALAVSLIPALSGNTACFNMAAFSFVAENTPQEKRTAQTGVAHSMMFFGVTVGLALSGVIAKSGLGFANVFLLGVLLEGAIFAYVLLGVKEKAKKKGSSFGTMFMEIFDFKHITDAAEVVTKRREGNTRTKLYILLAAHFCAFAPLMGEMTVYFLFGNYKFNWDGGQLGLFLTFKNVVGFVGNFITMGILTEKLKLSDPVIGIIGVLSLLTSSLYYASVNSGHLMFVGPILGILSGASIFVPRSILSKMMPADELGKVNSFLGCIDSVAPLMAGPIYSLLYTHTFQVFPGTFFLLTALLTIPPLLGYLYFLAHPTKEASKKN